MSVGDRRNANQEEKAGGTKLSAYERNAKSLAQSLIMSCLCWDFRES
jgi:hypothetical protein